MLSARARSGPWQVAGQSSAFFRTLAVLRSVLLLRATTEPAIPSRALPEQYLQASLQFASQRCKPPTGFHWLQPASTHSLLTRPGWVGSIGSASQAWKCHRAVRLSLVRFARSWSHCNGEALVIPFGSAVNILAEYARHQDRCRPVRGAWQQPGARRLRSLRSRNMALWCRITRARGLHFCRHWSSTTEWARQHGREHMYRSRVGQRQPGSVQIVRSTTMWAAAY